MIWSADKSVWTALSWNNILSLFLSRLTLSSTGWDFSSKFCWSPIKLSLRFNSRVTSNKSWFTVSSPVQLSLFSKWTYCCSTKSGHFLTFELPRLLAFWILLVVEAFFNRLPSGSWRGFTAFRWRFSGKSNIVGTGFAFVGPNPPSKCLEHIGVCLVTFRLSSRHAAIHLRRLSCSLIPGTYCIFSLFCGKQWKVTFVEGTNVITGHKCNKGHKCNNIWSQM